MVLLDMKVESRRATVGFSASTADYRLIISFLPLLSGFFYWMTAFFTIRVINALLFRVRSLIAISAHSIYIISVVMPSRIRFLSCSWRINSTMLLLDVHIER